MSARLRVQVAERPVVAEAGIAHALAERFDIVLSGADVAVLDLNSMHVEAGVAVRGLREATPAPRVLVLSSLVEREQVAGAIRAGAEGFLVSVRSWSSLCEAIELLAAGRYVYGPEVARAFAEADAETFEVVDAAFWEFEPLRPQRTPAGTDDGGGALSVREVQILRRVATGHSSQSIARSLAISVPTVRKHRENLMRKLGLHNVAEVTAYALRNDLLGPPED